MTAQRQSPWDQISQKVPAPSCQRALKTSQ